MEQTMKKPKFPRVIHVIVELPESDEAYLAIVSGGVLELDNPQPVAVYQLVEVGRAEITKKFVSRKRK